MNNQSIKKDNGKPRLDLVPLEILEPLARVREFAVKKYGKDGIEAWREISDDRLLAALLRHLVTYQKNPNALDEESGLPAIYHVVINAAFLAIKTEEKEHHESEKPIKFHKPPVYCLGRFRHICKMEGYIPSKCVFCSNFIENKND